MASLSAAHRTLGGRLTLSGSIVYNGEMLDTDFRGGFIPERTELDAYKLVSLKAEYRVTDALQLHLRLENAIDEEYEEVIGYATPGRAAFAGVSYRFAN